MSNYKDTLNLPSTGFPMKANLANREPNILQFWNDIDLYNSLQKATENRPKFVLHDGPPYANGDIHIGHAVNKILKDIINKMGLMSGYSTPYVPGWDCHGLPIEIQVEKKHGRSGHKLSHEEFRKASREYAESQIKIQIESFIRLGVTANWKNPYKTMSYDYEANIIRSLAKIVDNGHLAGGYKPVYWCIHCRSALAEAEVEYIDKVSPAIDVKFEFIEPNKLQDKLGITTPLDKIAIPIWTTTPWTLPANQAVAVNAEANYCLLKLNNAEGLIVAENLKESVLNRFKIESANILSTFEGSQIENFTLKHPFQERQVPVILGAHVTMDAGTGAVHTAPAHGEEDFLAGKLYNLPIDNPVDGAGRYIEGTPIFAGENVFKANEPIIELLKENGKLYHHEEINHSYPCCWRHKKPLIYRATKQWFISMDKNGLRHQALEAINKINWLPEWGLKRMRNMLENRPDWCISRQRNWGTPLPLLIHKATGEIHPDTPAIMERVAKEVEKEGLEGWYRLEAADLIDPEEAKNYEKCQDILDVWLDAGVSHACVLDKRDELTLPAEVYLEGNDQFRGWFQSSLLTSLAMYGFSSMKTIIAHGYTVDKEGRKMSKSLGNVIKPKEVINKLGADILRLWAASSDYWGDMRVSDEIFKRTSDTYRRIRNTARFLLSNLNDFDPNKNQVPYEDMLSLDKWALDHTLKTQESIIDDYKNYRFHQVAQKLHHFCSLDMGGFYLDIVKDRQYTLPKDSIARRSAQTAMYHILEAFVRWLSPILSFTAEEIWQNMPWQDDKSVFFATWYDKLQALGETELDQAYWAEARAVRDEVNKIIEQARNDNKIGGALEANITLYCNNDFYKKLSKLGSELHFLLITSGAEIKLNEEQTLGQKSDLEGLRIEIDAVSSEKCVRCWHRTSDVGTDKDHPELCVRCIGNITDQWENRKHL